MVIFQFANCKRLPEGTYLYPRPKTGWHQMFFKHPKVLLGIWSHPQKRPQLWKRKLRSWKENAKRRPLRTHWNESNNKSGDVGRTTCNYTQENMFILFSIGDLSCSFDCFNLFHSFTCCFSEDFVFFDGFTTFPQKKKSRSSCRSLAHFSALAFRDDNHRTNTWMKNGIRCWCINYCFNRKLNFLNSFKLRSERTVILYITLVI